MESIDLLSKLREISDMNWRTCQTSIMECLTKIVYGRKLLTNFAETSIIVLW